MRERLRFESEIQDLGLETSLVFKERQALFDANATAEQLKPIFLAKFSFKKAGAKWPTPFGAQLGKTVPIDMVSDSDLKKAWADEVKIRADALEKTVLKFAPELILAKLQGYYKALGQPLPARLSAIDENTVLDRDERAVLFTLIKQMWIIQAEKEIDKLQGFYSHNQKKIVMKESSADVAVLAHEMAHAYADQSWHDFIVMMTLRNMKDAITLDEGMATHIERIVVNEFIKKQKDKKLKAPPAAYDKSFTDKAQEFIKLVGQTTAFESYFAGQIDFTDNAKPEDSLILGKGRKKWKWKWR